MPRSPSCAGALVHLGDRQRDSLRSVRRVDPRHPFAGSLCDPQPPVRSPAHLPTDPPGRLSLRGLQRCETDELDPFVLCGGKACPERSRRADEKHGRRQTNSDGLVFHCRAIIRLRQAARGVSMNTVMGLCTPGLMRRQLGISIILAGPGHSGFRTGASCAHPAHAGWQTQPHRSLAGSRHGLTGTSATTARSPAPSFSSARPARFPAARASSKAARFRISRRRRQSRRKTFRTG